MSYAEIKPDYYRMFQPDSPWHAGSAGWKSAPWPGWGRNPALVGPARLATNGLGAYFAPVYERPITGASGLGSAGCGCGRPVGDDAATLPTPAPSAGLSSNVKGALMIAGAGLVLVAMFAIPGHWDE